VYVAGVTGVSVEPVSVEPVSVEPVSVEPVSVEPVSVEPVSTISVEPVSVEPVLELPEPVPQAVNILNVQSAATADNNAFHFFIEFSSLKIYHNKRSSFISIPKLVVL
jgi:hypothetical protein